MAYDAEQNVYYDAQLSACDSYILDLTEGSLAAGPGMEVTFSLGLAARASYQTVVRARPNTAYPLELKHRHTYPTRMTAADHLNWTNVASIVPFAPQTVQQTSIGDAVVYAYSDLTFILDRSMSFPLDENSVVVGMDGFAFGSVNGLIGTLAHYQSTPFTEIWYYQRDEEPVALRRALLPTLRRDTNESVWLSVRPEWDEHPSSVATVSDDDAATVVGAIGFVIFAKLLYELGVFDEQGNLACTNPNECD
jgi:hypothetical protein